MLRAACQVYDVGHYELRRMSGRVRARELPINAKLLDLAGRPLGWSSAGLRSASSDRSRASAPRDVSCRSPPGPDEKAVIRWRTQGDHPEFRRRACRAAITGSDGIQHGDRRHALLVAGARGDCPLHPDRLGQSLDGRSNRHSSAAAPTEPRGVLSGQERVLRAQRRRVGIQAIAVTAVDRDRTRRS